MKSTNPRDVAFLFREYCRKIHVRAVPEDPNFIRLSVACGKVRLVPLPPFLSSLSLP